MTEQSADENLVRETWELVEICQGRIFSGRSQPTIHLKLPVIWHKCLNVMFAKSLEEAWAAAAEFTRARLEQIRLVEEEIDVIEFLIGAMPQQKQVIDRILASRKVALTELKRGLKEQGNE